MARKRTPPPPTGREGVHLNAPGPQKLVPFSRNPEYKGGGDREALCYAQPLCTVMDFSAGNQSPLGSETPSSPSFVANRGGTTSTGAAGRDRQVDNRLMTHQDGVRYPGIWQGRPEHPDIGPDDRR